MIKLAIAVEKDTGFAYPIYKSDGMYFIDMGGAMGMSDPLEFDNDVKAISFLQHLVENQEEQDM